MPSTHKKKTKNRVGTAKIKDSDRAGSKCKKEKSEKGLSYEDQIVSLFCNHCKTTFKAKPTYRQRFNHTLVNHSCLGNKRRQYVLGVKRRKCVFACNSIQGCI